MMFQTVGTVFLVTRYTENKLTSTNDISFNSNFAAFNAFLIEGAGPIPIIDGSTPSIPYDTSLAKGVRLCCLHASSLARTSAQAPSLMPY